MKPGNKYFFLSFFFIFFFSLTSVAEDKISTTPLINLDKLKPSFEESNDVTNDITDSELIKSKKKF